MHEDTLCGTRETPPSALGEVAQGPHGEPARGTAVMHEGGESDSSIVPQKRPNNVESWTMIEDDGKPYTGTQVETPETAKGEPKVLSHGQDEAAEVVEGRGLAKGNLEGCDRDRTLCRGALQQALDRVRQAARRAKASLPCSMPMRYYLRQESGAVMLHAGICAGGVG